MTTYIKNLKLSKDETNDYIDAESVSIEINNENIKSIMDCIKAMPEAAVQSRVELSGNISWLKDNVDSDDRMDYEEIIIFKNGDLFVTALEKYNSIVVESECFRIAEVDSAIEAKEAKTEDEKENIIFENKMMAEALESLGFSQEEISDICNGSTKVGKYDLINLATKKMSAVIADVDDNYDVKNIAINVLAETHTDDKYKDVIEVVFELEEGLVVTKDSKVDLLSIDDVNIGVIREHGISTELVEMSNGTFYECPSCLSSEIVFDIESPDCEGDFVYRTHCCKNCDLKFDERYDLTRVTTKRDGE